MLLPLKVLLANEDTKTEGAATLRKLDHYLAFWLNKAREQTSTSPYYYHSSEYSCWSMNRTISKHTTFTSVASLSTKHSASQVSALPEHRKIENQLTRNLEHSRIIIHQHVYLVVAPLQLRTHISTRILMLSRPRQPTLQRTTTRHPYRCLDPLSKVYQQTKTRFDQ